MDPLCPNTKDIITQQYLSSLVIMLATLLLIGFTRWRRLLYLWGPLIIAARLGSQQVNFDPYLHLDHHVDLPYCSLSNIFHGTWKYKEYNDDVPLITTWSQMISSSFETCPGTLDTVKSSQLDSRGNRFSIAVILAR
jgi:hypothetical protein